MYHKRLLNNVNTWGKVEFNVPLRVSDNETRTSYNVGHRYIPPVQKYFLCLNCDKSNPMPVFNHERQIIMKRETYKTTYENHVNFKRTKLPNSTFPVADLAEKVRYITWVESKLNCDKSNPMPVFNHERQIIMKRETYKTTYENHVNFKRTKLPNSTFPVADLAEKVRYITWVESKIDKGMKGERCPIESTTQSSYTDKGPYPSSGSPTPGSLLGSSAVNKSQSTADAVKIAVGSKGVIRHLDPYLSSYLLHYGISPDAIPPPPTSETITINSGKGKQAKKGRGDFKVVTGIPKKILKEQADKVVRDPFKWCKSVLQSENRRHYTDPMTKSRLCKVVNTAGGVVWDPNPSPYKKLAIL